MREGPSQVTVRAREGGGLLLELYNYSEGWCEPLPVHAHAEYQFALCLDQPGSYLYRGGRHRLPVGALAVLHAGEPHMTGDERSRLLPAASHLMMYVEPRNMLTFEEEATGRTPAAPPYFPQVTLKQDRTLLRAFAALFRSREPGRTRLERDAADLAFFTKLITRHAHDRRGLTPDMGGGRPVGRAVEYLHSNFSGDVTLDELAAVAGVSKFHLVREFRRQVGMTPHKYLLTLRVGHAKRLLLGGLTAAAAATHAGFYDESHLGKYFKQIVGVSPGSYSGGKDRRRQPEAER